MRRDYRRSESRHRLQHARFRDQVRDNDDPLRTRAFGVTCEHRQRRLFAVEGDPQVLRIDDHGLGDPVDNLNAVTVGHEDDVADAELVKVVKRSAPCGSVARKDNVAFHPWLRRAYPMADPAVKHRHCHADANRFEQVDAWNA